MQIEFVRWLALLALVFFCGYTLYCSRTENFRKSCRGVLAYRWGRQVTIDLYLGLFLFVFFIYLREGSLDMALLWLLPTLVLGNIVPLFYFFLFFDSIVQRCAQV